LPLVLPLVLSTVAHAQGTMDFSGAQTLMGTFKWSRFIGDGQYLCHAQLHAQHERFARLWDRNLCDQGFAEAFERQRQPHA